MKTTEFCYWLQGMFELNNPVTLNEQQTQIIKQHLAMVFIHDIDQSYPKEQQEKLNQSHNPHHPSNVTFRC